MHAFKTAIIASMALASPVEAATFTPFDVPTGPACGYAISPDGIVVGAPEAPAPSSSYPGGYVPAFLRAGNGTITSLAVGPSRRGLTVAYVRPTGINYAHTIVGYQVNDTFNVVTTNFLYKSGRTSAWGVDTKFPYVLDLGPVGISADGLKVGNYGASFIGHSYASPFLSGPGATGLLTGLSTMYASSVLTAIDRTGTWFSGIGYGGAAPQISFVYTKGIVTSLPTLGDALLTPAGIDSHGRISGTYITVSPAGILSHHGFVLAGGVVTTLDPPGSTDTFLTGLTDGGQFTGCYTDNNGRHAYIGKL